MDKKADPTDKTNQEWRDQLSPEQFQVCRLGGTEHAFSGAYWNEHRPGTYSCVCCGEALFRSDEKFDSGTGWPSFFLPAAAGAVKTHEDHSLGMRRIEVQCARCGSHLGHLFPDGPPPTRLRYCINSAALCFADKVP